MMGMEVGCEDALKQLKELLQETGGDIEGSSYGRSSYGYLHRPQKAV
jgi:hypothetical protein